MGLPLDDVTECLYEPAASRGVSPAVKPRDGATDIQICGHAYYLLRVPVGYQKVCMVWYFIRSCSSIMLCPDHVSAMVQLVSLTSLQMR